MLINGKLTFDLFRFQILPRTRNQQASLFDEVHSLDELIRRKNEFFGQILQHFPQLSFRGEEIVQKIIFQSEEWLVGQLGTHKELVRGNSNLESEVIDDWPKITFLINNDPQIQTIAISTNRRAFSSTSVVASLLQSNLQRLLDRYHLVLHVEAQFNKIDFWKIIRQHQGQILSVRFQCVTPNMSSITDDLEIDLKQLAKDTNAQKTEIELKNAEGTVLEINQKNPIINSLVEYAAKGGGDISIRAKNIKKRIHTSTTLREIEIDELTIKNANADNLELIKRLLE
jgi:hypothetical protein